MAVYVITHKKFDMIPEYHYYTLLVGAYRGHVFGDYYDDDGENISEKNAHYCELTGMYWLWKNRKDDYVGVVHYRRFFSRYFSRAKKLKETDIKKALERYDMILPFRRTLDDSVWNQYCRNSGYAKDLEKVRDILSDLCPEYLPVFDSVMAGRKLYLFNMMICRKELFDAYCEWLFPILFELERQTDLSGYDDYRKRIYGFMSERLLTVWVFYHKLNICEAGVVNTENKESVRKELLMAMKRVLLFGSR